MAAIIRFSCPTPVTPTQTAFVRDYETAFAVSPAFPCWVSLDAPTPAMQQWIGPNSPFNKHTFSVAETDPSTISHGRGSFSPAGVLELDLGDWQARGEPSISYAGNITLDKRTFSVDLSFEREDDANGSQSAVYTEQYWRDVRRRPLLRCVDLPDTDEFASDNSSDTDVSSSSETDYMNWDEPTSNTTQAEAKQMATRFA
ncbi:hypothetical protein BKA62DRAFT_715133 [Auriculariales sp. MPI-PUGE-AT-0066]|nr:hypothetical protein BKA62DRAFT_715133 [Auriculariales sp. MPI-PUGE-AT-0066]